jgi:hypothetical protein
MLNYNNPRYRFSEIEAVYDTVKIMNERSLELETDKRMLKGGERINKGNI